MDVGGYGRGPAVEFDPEKDRRPPSHKPPRSRDRARSHHRKLSPGPNQTRLRVDAAYISAFAALAGTAIGGLASFATSWTTQHAQTRAQRIATERDARAELFGRFLDEAAKLYADALQSRRDDISRLTGIYALTNCIASHRRTELCRAPTRWPGSVSRATPRRT